MRYRHISVTSDEILSATSDEIFSVTSESLTLINHDQPSLIFLSSVFHIRSQAPELTPNSEIKQHLAPFPNPVAIAANRDRSLYVAFGNGTCMFFGCQLLELLLVGQLCQKSSHLADPEAEAAEGCQRPKDSTGELFKAQKNYRDREQNHRNYYRFRAPSKSQEIQPRNAGEAKKAGIQNLFVLSSSALSQVRIFPGLVGKNITTQHT